MHLSNLACTTYTHTDIRYVYIQNLNSPTLLASIKPSVIFMYLISVEERMQKVKSEDFTVTTAENTIVLAMASYGLVEANGYFRGIYCFFYRVQRVS